MNWMWAKLLKTDSTNDYARLAAENELVVTADYQFCGRGQAGSTWESEAGKNLLMSIKISPSNVLAREQFVLSMAGALSVKDALDAFGSFKIKWPNDIYWKDRKISGTLIETTVAEKKVQTCIFGIGLNVNQCRFRSNAPNPVSLLQITHKETKREKLLSCILEHFEEYFQKIENGNYYSVYQAYNDSLYRKGKYHSYEDENGLFEAKILHVEPDGHLVLLDRNDALRRYAFKEVRYII